MRTWILGLIAAGVSAFSPVASANPAVGDGFYAGVGTLGVNLGYKVGAAENFGVRVGFNRFRYDTEIEEGDVDYEGDLKLSSLEVLFDWHPFADGFALTAGFLSNENKFTGKAGADGSGALTLNGVRYTGVNPSAEVTAKFGDGVTPYLGIGYIANPSAAKGFRINMAIGVVFQQPDVDLTVSGVNDPNGTLAADRAAAEREIRKDLDKLRHYPVLTLGVSYSF